MTQGFHILWNLLEIPPKIIPLKSSFKTILLDAVKEVKIFAANLFTLKKNFGRIVKYWKSRRQNISWSNKAFDILHRFIRISNKFAHSRQFSKLFVEFIDEIFSLRSFSVIIFICRYSKLISYVYEIIYKDRRQKETLIHENIYTHIISNREVNRHTNTCVCVFCTYIKQYVDIFSLSTDVKSPKRISFWKRNCTLVR